MFDNTKSNESRESDLRLRKNLRGFDRNSLKILHPLFRDALRLLAHRRKMGKCETLLLPLVRFVPPQADALDPSGMIPVAAVKREAPVLLHH